MSEMTPRDRLRAMRPPTVEPLEFDTAAAPEHPLDLFREWLDSAGEADVSQANAMTLSTSSAAGVPSARTLLLKDVTDAGFWFASLSDGPKGSDLAANPRAALTMFWREQGRQVRVSGTVRPGPRAVSEGDFTARHPVARAQAIAGRQSEPMPEAEVVDRLIASARELLDGDPDFVPSAWTAYVVEPHEVEFWQAVGRDQVRLRYRLVDEQWRHELIWP